MSNVFTEFLNKEGNEEIKKQFKLHLLENDDLMNQLISDATGSGKLAKASKPGTGEARPKIEYPKFIHQIVKDSKDKEGVHIKDIVAKAVSNGATDVEGNALSDKADRARILVHLKGKSAQNVGIVHLGASKFKYEKVK